MDRNEALKSLRDYVVEVTTVIEGKQKSDRITLKLEHLPNSPEYDLAEETLFHNKNPDLVVAWNMVKRRWDMFNIEDIKYMQIIDAY